MKHTYRYLRLLVPIMTLPVLAGAGICGVVLYDIAQRTLVNEPVREVHFESDSGSVEVFAFARNGVNLFYYLVGSDRDIGDIGHRVAGETLEVFVLCDHTEYCNANYSAEVPLGTKVTIEARNGGVKLTQVDAAVTADVVGGGVDGLQLRAPELTLTVESGDVTLDWLVAPSSVDIVVGEGVVDLTVPAGSYRCELRTDGPVTVAGVTCDPTAASVIAVEVGAGEIHLNAVEP